MVAPVPPPPPPPLRRGATHAVQPTVQTGGGEDRALYIFSPARPFPRRTITNHIRGASCSALNTLPRSPCSISCTLWILRHRLHLLPKLEFIGDPFDVVFTSLKRWSIPKSPRLLRCDPLRPSPSLNPCHACRSTRYYNSDGPTAVNNPGPE